MLVDSSSVVNRQLVVDSLPGFGRPLVGEMRADVDERGLTSGYLRRTSTKSAQLPAFEPNSAIGALFILAPAMSCRGSPMVWLCNSLVHAGARNTEGSRLAGALVAGRAQSARARRPPWDSSVRKDRQGRSGGVRVGRRVWCDAVAPEGALGSFAARRADGLALRHANGLSAGCLCPFWGSAASGRVPGTQKSWAGRSAALPRLRP